MATVIFLVRDNNTSNRNNWGDLPRDVWLGAKPRLRVDEAVNNAGKKREQQLCIWHPHFYWFLQGGDLGYRVQNSGFSVQGSGGWVNHMFIS